MTVGFESVHKETVSVLFVTCSEVGHFILEVEVLLVHVENGDPAVVKGQEVGFGDALETQLVR